MLRKPVHLTVFLSILSLTGVDPCVGAEPPPLDGFSSRVEVRVDDFESIRSRISGECKTAGGEIRAFVDEAYSSGGIALSGFGISTPVFELGPLRESGFMSALNRPGGIGSITERSSVSLDRSFDGSSLTGGLIRFRAAGAHPRTVELYGAARGGLAPAGTKTGAAVVSSDLGNGVSLDLGARMTLFGAQDAEGDWFLDAPEVTMPSIFHAGARVLFRGHRVIATIMTGAAFSEAARPSSFVAGSAGLAGDLLRSGPRGPAFGDFSARIDACAVDAGYVGGDGRYPTRILLVHPVVSLRIPGLRLTGWYRCDYYRLPLLPVAYRRVTHSGSIGAEVSFGQFSAGAWLKPFLDFAEDGRTVYRLRCGPRAGLVVGSVSLETALELTRSNLEDPKVGARLGARGQWGGGTAAASVDVDEGLGRLTVDVAAIGRGWRFGAAVTLPEFLTVDFGAPAVSLNGSLGNAVRGASCTVSCELGR